MKDWGIEGGRRFSLSLDLHDKLSSQTELKFTTGSLSPMFRWLLEQGSIGVGPSLQRIGVAGEHFRDAYGVHADWILPSGEDNHWVIMVDAAKNEHQEDYQDMDSRSLLLMLQRHEASPWTGIDALDLELGITREWNARGFNELSNRSLFARASIEKQMAGITWGIGLTANADRFDDTPLPEWPRRRDRALQWEFSAEHVLSQGLVLRLESSAAKNRANLPLYENRYRLTSLTLSQDW